MKNALSLQTVVCFSGATHGPCIGHISPEAAAQGPIAFVEDEDEIEIDIPNRTLKLMVSESELKKERGLEACNQATKACPCKICRIRKFSRYRSHHETSIQNPINEYTEFNKQK
jgi:dihydroxyacid dehydratase/phosphogluconate dehydratase